MGTPINQELRELRMAKEHYERVLKNDSHIKESGSTDGVLLLSDEDIVKINAKLEVIGVKINELLNETNDYMV